MSVLSFPQDLSAEISAVADRAYDAVAQAEDLPLETIHYQEVCDKAVEFILDNLLDNGHRVERVVRAAQLGREYDSQGHLVPILHETRPSRRISHVYCELDAEGDETDTQVIDATWQQFLAAEKRTPELPKVLIGTHSQVLAKLQEYGITDMELLGLWATRPGSLQDDLRRLQS
ncbi:MAG TPA: hypothetical protein VLE74_03655 [Candidatus Saccharimonadales bacterium]|nr:hypothetical protein [Candidatus Saccharimonadales bacterium]